MSELLLYLWHFSFIIATKGANQFSPYFYTNKHLWSETTNSFKDFNQEAFYTKGPNWFWPALGASEVCYIKRVSYNKKTVFFNDHPLLFYANPPISELLRRPINTILFLRHWWGNRAFEFHFMKKIQTFIQPIGCIVFQFWWDTGLQDCMVSKSCIKQEVEIFWLTLGYVLI